MSDSRSGSENDQAAASPSGRFTLERLSSAFARLMGAPSLAAAQAARPEIAVETDDDQRATDADGVPVTPQMIVEGMLFVGAAGAQSLSRSDIAAQIRNVGPAEVDALVAELNKAYQRDDAAYEITSDGDGYRMQLRPDLASMCDRLRGQRRATRLTPAALEALAVVAYGQGATGEEVNRLRGAQSYAVLSQLVRRELLRVERPAAAPRTVRYYTTERFNRLFGVASPADLPRSEDLDDC